MPKVTHCLWRAWKDSLPTRPKLIERGIEIDLRCPMCGEDIESAQHLFLQCWYAKRRWELSVLRALSWCDNKTSLQEAICHAVSRVPEEAISHIFMLIWAIWGSRNKWVFEACWLEPEHVVSQALALLQEFERVLLTAVTDSKKRKEDQRWRGPKEGRVKINSDASLVKGVRGGMGVVIRDARGHVRGAKQAVTHDVSDIEVLEARAVLEGLNLAHKLNLRNVEVNSDCAYIMKMLSSRNLGLEPSRVIIFECFSYLCCFDSISFALVNRVCNKVAHCLAFQAAKFESSGRMD